jgi:hypothetical protein
MIVNNAINQDIFINTSGGFFLGSKITWSFFALITLTVESDDSLDLGMIDKIFFLKNVFKSTWVMMRILLVFDGALGLV